MKNSQRAVLNKIINNKIITGTLEENIGYF
jgi:hypothetical protein